MANPLIKKLLGESQQAQEPLEVIEGQRVEYYDICPHCNQEIYERHVFFEGQDLENHKAFHSDCKGPIIWPRKRIREENAKWAADPRSLLYQISHAQ